MVNGHPRIVAKYPSVFPALAWALFFMLAACSGSGSSGSSPHRLLVRLAEEPGRDHPTASASREIVRLADRASDGRILVRVYEDGYLGDESELIDQLRFGGVDIAVVDVRSLESISKTAAVLGRSRTFPDAASMDAALSGPMGRALGEELESERMMFLSWYDGGPECLLLPYARLEPNIEGLRIGVGRSKSIMEEIAAAGAVPIPITLLDMRRSLESDLVEGVRAPLAFVMSNRFDADYRVFPIWDSRGPVLVVGSRVSLMKMPAKDRELLIGAVRDSRGFQSDALAFLEKRYLRDAASAAVVSRLRR